MKRSYKHINLYRKASLTLKSPKTAYNVLHDFVFGVKNKKYPRVIDLFITERCNFSCSMCQNRDSRVKNNVKGDLNFEYIKKIIKESKKWSPYIQLYGGEPTLYKNLANTIKLFSANNMVCGLTTNGFLLDRLNDNLVNSGLDFLNVSLDGWDEESQKRRGNISGSFGKIIEGLNNIRSLRGAFPHIRISTVITKNNFKHLEKIYDVVNILGIDSWFIVNYIFVTKQVLELNKKFYKETKIGADILGDQINDDSYFSSDEVQIIKDQLFKIRDKSRQSKMHIHYNWDLNLNNYYSPKFPQENLCIVPYDGLFIRANGDIELCQGYKLGNISINSIKEVWDSKKVAYFRKVFEKNKIMPACFRCCAVGYNIKNIF